MRNVNLVLDTISQSRSTRQSRVFSHPYVWPVLGSGDIRRCLTNHFPYGIIYCIEADEILILAVMHLHRKPGYWKERYS